MTYHSPLVLCAGSAVAGIAIGVLIGRISRKQPDQAQKDDPTSSRPSGLSELTLLLDAAHFSAQKHRDQRRKNPTQAPYINHPISVAHRLAVDGGVTDVNVLVAALLHDTVEDTDTTLEEVKQIFGATIAGIVDEVSDDKTLAKEVRKQLQIEHAPRASSNAKLVKLADKLDNLSDLLENTPVGWKSDRVGEYFDWAEKVIAGLRGTSPALEEMLDSVLQQKENAMQLSEAS